MRIITLLISLVALAACDEAPILNHCDGDFCYRNGFKIDSNNNYIED